MTPTVGRTVHYQAYGTPGGEYPSVARAAVITQTQAENPKLEEGVVGLCILNPTGMFFTQEVRFSEVPKPGHWSWPPRIP